jgi:hypothetical protein
MQAKFGPLEKKDTKPLTSIQMQFFGITAGYTVFDKRNEEILEEMKVERVDEKRRRCKSNLLRHVTRMNINKMLKIILTCAPNGRRRLERPLNRLLDDPGTGLSRPKS